MLGNIIVDTYILNVNGSPSVLLPIIEHRISP